MALSPKYRAASRASTRRPLPHRYSRMTGERSWGATSTGATFRVCPCRMTALPAAALTLRTRSDLPARATRYALPPRMVLTSSVRRTLPERRPRTSSITTKSGTQPCDVRNHLSHWRCRYRLGGSW